MGSIRDEIDWFERCGGGVSSLPFVPFVCRSDEDDEHTGRVTIPAAGRFHRGWRLGVGALFNFPLLGVKAVRYQQCPAEKGLGQ